MKTEKIQVVELRDDYARSLMAKGEHTAAEVITTAIECNEIDEDDRALLRLRRASRRLV